MSQDLLADGKTPCERRFGYFFLRTTYSIWCTGRIPPKFRERQSWNSSIRKESITRNLLWTCFDRGRNWRGDILITDIEELEKLDASEIFPRRLNAKEVLITHEDGEFVFPVADGSAKLSEGDYEFQESTLRREPTVRRKNLSGESQGDRESFNLKKQKMTQKLGKTFGLFKEISFIVIILNREFNCMCREKNHSLFH